MALDVTAALGIRVDSSSVAPATASLQGLTKAGAEAEAQVNRLGASTRTWSRAVTEETAARSAARQALRDQAAAYQSARAAAEAMAVAEQQAALAATTAASASSGLAAASTSPITSKAAKAALNLRINGS